jgi:DNA mismatch repair ATPase MutS
VITRARAILEALEHDELARGGRPSISGTPAGPQQQLGLFQAPVEVEQKTDTVVQRLRDLDTNAITPLQALTILADLKKDAR